MEAAPAPARPALLPAAVEPVTALQELEFNPTQKQIRLLNEFESELYAPFILWPVLRVR